LGSTLCLVAILATLGGNLAALQMVAWARMLVQFSKTDTVGAAISKTFDGKHPCALCLTIRESRQQEGNSAAQGLSSVDDKLRELFWVPNSPVSLTEIPLTTSVLPAEDSFYSGYISLPPTPPPKSTAAAL